MKRVFASRVKGFAAVPMDALLDPRLTWKAKGLLALLLNLPEGQPLPNLMRNCSKDGRDSVRRGIDELVATGYARVDDQRIEVMPTSAENASVSTVGSAGNAAIREGNLLDSRNAAKPSRSKPKRAEKPSVPHTRERAVLNPEREGSSKSEGEVELFPAQAREGNRLYRNSALSDFSVVLHNFRDEEAAGIDLRYYHQVVGDWSDASNKRRTDKGWIATLRQFMRRDHEAGRLKRATGANDDDDIIKYLEL